MKEHFSFPPLFFGGGGELHCAEGGLRHGTGSGSVPQLDSVIMGEQCSSPVSPASILAWQHSRSPKAQKQSDQGGHLTTAPAPPNLASLKGQKKTVFCFGLGELVPRPPSPNIPSSHKTSQVPGSWGKSWEKTPSSGKKEDWREGTFFPPEWREVGATNRNKGILKFQGEMREIVLSEKIKGER